MNVMERRRKRLGLQARMTISYLGVTVVIALLLELLVCIIAYLVLTRSPLLNDVILNTAKQTAQVYAFKAASQLVGTTLDPRSTFQPGQPSSLALPGDDSSKKIPYFTDGVPYIDPHSSHSQVVEFALLIAPNGQVLASSYPEGYPVSTPVTRVLPNQAQLILNALAGRTGNMVEDTSQGHIASAAQTVWNSEKKPVGAVYVQVTLGASDTAILSTIAGGWLRSGPGLLLIMIPFGVVFGIVTTRGLVRRIHRLVFATAEFATGDYTQRVPITRQDEIGQLELQFNSMAEQLVESIAQQQTLTEQHARLEERARIEQELRTAQYIQRALLPKGVPPLPGWQLVPVYLPAREVGGDFYDFLVFEDGRLGIVIGDATDKGVSAALLMATTCTMLRTATQGTISPGEVLARVNDLLSANVPSGMFVTCFYAMLDPGSGRLCYANAGHDLPYLRHKGEVSELHATGMPLGLMPGTHYEEKEIMLAHGDSLLLYSDGLVEAHNTKRDMFSFPYLMALFEEDVAGKELLDFLLSKLAAFTGPDWEQEDDVTLVTLQRDHGVSETAPRSATQFDQMDGNDSWQTLGEWTVPSQPGNEQHLQYVFKTRGRGAYCRAKPT